MDVMTGKAFSLNVPSLMRFSQRCNRGKAQQNLKCSLHGGDEAVNETGEKSSSHPHVLALDKSTALILPKRLWQSLGTADRPKCSIPSVTGDIHRVHDQRPKLRSEDSAIFQGTGCWDAAQSCASPWRNTNSLHLPQKTLSIWVTYQQEHWIGLMLSLLVLTFSIYSLNGIHIPVYEMV